MYVRCDESSLYSRINYVHSPDGELLCRSVRIIKTMHTQGLKRVHVLHYANAPVHTEETGRYDLAEDLVFWMLSVNSNELSRYSNIFYVHGYL